MTFTFMTAAIEDRLYEWSRTSDGDIRLKIWEDGSLIEDDVFPAEDFR